MKAKRPVYQPWPFKPIASPRSLFRYQPPYVRAKRRRDRGQIIGALLMLAPGLIVLIAFAFALQHFDNEVRKSTTPTTIVQPTDHN